MIVVNPNGSGLTNGNLALATATPADVLSGKTFFAGGREMQTGTLVPKAQYKSGTFNFAEEKESYDRYIDIPLPFSPMCVFAFGRGVYATEEYIDCTMSNGKKFHATNNYGINTGSCITLSGNGFRYSWDRRSSVNVEYYAYG